MSEPKEPSRGLSPTAAKKTRPQDPLAGLRQAIKAYRLNSARMAPKEAAKGWITLSDRCQAANAIWSLQDANLESSLFPEVMSVLPGPSVWPEIEALLKRRLSVPKPSQRDRATLAMFSSLLGNHAEGKKNLMALTALSVEQMAIRAYIGVDLALLGGKPNEILSAYHELAVALSRQTQPIGSDKKIELPDLTHMLGAERVKALVRDLLHSFDGELVTIGGPEFNRVVRAAAISSAGSLKHPQWWLAVDVEGGPLFEALVKRFPNVSRGIQENPDWNNDSYSAAASRYVTYLVANDRVDEATTFFKAQDGSSWFTRRVLDDETELLKKRGKVDAYIAFLEKILSGGDLETQPFEVYQDFCESVGQAKRAEAFLERLPSFIKNAEDRTYRTVMELISANKLAEAGTKLAEVVRRQMASKSEERSYPNMASKLVDVGRYLHRQDLVDLGISAGIKALREADSVFTEIWVWEALVEEGRAVEAEHLLADVLQQQTHSAGSFSSSGNSDELGALVRLYARGKRHADVLTVLQGAPNWGAADLAFVNSYEQGVDPLTFVAAQALVAVGRPKEALHVLQFLLQEQPEFDDAYALIIDTDPGFAAKLLGNKRRQRPMDSRPLMWSAELLRREGKLANAEKLVRKAIALDPQDTAAISSRARFQAWAILASIKQAQGKEDEAAAYRRKFESPQKHFWGGQGYLEMEIDPCVVLRRALVDNPDDFLCRFDLADQLRSQGNHSEAEAQTIEACRRAVSQFGPASEVNVFEDLALCQRTLEEELAKDPKRASIYALLGQIHLQAEEFDGAVEAFMQAVSIEPDYLAGWEGLFEVMQHRPLVAELGDRVAFNLARLDPWAFQSRAGATHDFSRLWQTAYATLGDSGPVDEPIVALPTSAAKMEGADDVNVENARRWRRPPSPGTIIARERIISDFVRLIGTLPVGAKK